MSEFREEADQQYEAERARLAVRYKSLDRNAFYKKKVVEPDFKNRIRRGLDNGDAWSAPDPKFSIDNQISYMIDPGQRPGEERDKSEPSTIRSREELRERGVLCPYECAREAVIYAASEADQATLDALFSKGIEAAYLDRRSKDASKLRKNLHSFIVSHAIKMQLEEFWKENLQTVPGKTPGRLSCLDEAYDLLQIIEDETKKHRKMLARKPESVWKDRYAEEMGRAYFCLTGRIPTPGYKYFEDFLQSGLGTIYDAYAYKGVREEVNWENYVKEACNSIKSNKGWTYNEPGEFFERKYPGQSLIRVGSSPNGRGLYMTKEQEEINYIVWSYAVRFSIANDDKSKQEIELELFEKYGRDVNLAIVVRKGYYVEPITFQGAGPWRATRGARSL